MRKNIFKITLSTILVALIVVITVISLSSNKDSFDAFNNTMLWNKATKIIDVKNSNYQLEVEEDTFAIKLTDTSSGKVLLESGNIIEDSPTYDNDLNNTWEAFAKNALVIYYTGEQTYKPLSSFTKVTSSIKEITNGIKATIKVGDIGLEFVLQIEVVGNYLDISIPYDSIKETNVKTPLISIAMFPFMNSSRGLQTNAHENLILVPDGAGAVMDLSKRTVGSNAYSARVYGEDTGVKGVSTYTKYGTTNPPLKVTYPAFGMVNDGSGFISSIESGAEYANINAYVSEIVTDYNFVYTNFVYRETYLQPMDNKGTVKATFQSDFNKFDAKVRYMFLQDDDASLSGMAKTYRKNLLEQGKLSAYTDNSSDVSLKLDFLIAENYNSVIGSKVVNMTSLDFIQSSLGSLKEAGVNNIVTGLSGYTKNGLRGASPNSFKKLEGSKSDYKNLAGYTAKNNIKLFAITDNIRVLEDRSSYKKKELAMTLGKKFVGLPNYLYASPLGSDFDYEFYLTLHANATKKYLEKDIASAKQYGFDGLDLETIGNFLASSHYDTTLTRTESMAIYQNMIKDKDIMYSMTNPSQYLWSQTSYAGAVNVTNSKFMIALDSVPFLQMVTNGSFYSFRNYINLDYSRQTDVLKMVEYGVYPSYILTEKNSRELMDTHSYYIFSSQYADWESNIIDTYHKVNDALSNVKDSEFIGYKILQDGVKQVEYSNGVEIVINYNAQSYVLANGDEVLPLSYKVVK